MAARRPRRGVAAALLCGLLQAAVAHAESPESEAAERLFEAGKKLMAEGRLEEACQELERSQELDPALGTLLNLADCYQRRGEGSRAYRTFVEVRTQAIAGGHDEVERVAEERSALLFETLPKIHIHVAARLPDLEVLQDGVAVPPTFWGRPLPLEPGSHTFEARAPRHTSHRVTLPVEDAPDRAPLPVEIPPLTPLQSSPRDESSSSLQPRQWIALGAGGVGLTGLVVGTVFGLKSIRVGHAADEHCDGPRCRTQEGVSLRADARRAGNVSTVGFVLGIAGAAGGAALWLSAQPTEDSGGTQVGLSADRIEVRYSW